MRHAKRIGLVLAGVAGGALWASSAAAQDQIWLKDRRYSEGMGVRTGDLELHPGVAGEFGYDSNYFLRADSEKPIDVLRARVTPSLTLSTLGPQRRDGDIAAEPPKVSFRAGAAVSYNEVIATKSENSKAASDQRHVGGLANLQLMIAPGRPWGAEMFGDFLRTVQPSNESDTSAAFNRINARGGALIVWQPGGGTFDWRLGGDYGATIFEKDPYTKLNNTTTEVLTRGRWRFLPRTALMYDASWGFIRYTSGTSTQRDSDPVRARVGLNGLLSPSFGILAMAGWGASFYKETGTGGGTAQQFDSAIGQLEFKWFITPNPGTDPALATLLLSSIAVGGTRDFVNSYLGDFFERDRGYLNVSYFFGGTFLVVLEGGVAAIRYPQINRGVSTPVASFTDLRYDATLFTEYRFSNSLGLNVTGRYTANQSDKKLPTSAGSTDDLQWKRVEAYLGVRWFL